MLKQIQSFVFSTRLMAVLFIGMAVAMAFGTFIESWYSTETARIWIYNAWWFEAIMVFFLINFIGNIKRYNLLKWEKWPVLLLHLAWILIIFGAFITRYFGFEGMMPIREGETEKVFYSDKTYLTLFLDGEIQGQPRRKVLESDLIVTEEGIKSNLPWKTDFNGTPIKIEFAEFIKGARMGVLPDQDGKLFLKLVEAGSGSRHDHFLEAGEVVNIHNVLFSLNRQIPGAVNIQLNEDRITLNSPFSGSFMRMADQYSGVVVADSIQELQLRSLYTLGSMQFVLPEAPILGKYGLERIPGDEISPEDPDALVLDITVGDKTQKQYFFGGKGQTRYSEPFELGGLSIQGSYGSKVHELPFSIALNDFIAEKYPGTEKGYSSYMSKITVHDSVDYPVAFDYDIYMNHVLDHRGYRFFQASFSPDEKGTVLSVNHDFWGTWITYFGYFLLYIGLMGIMFFGKTRFRDLGRQLENLKRKKAVLGLILFLGFSTLNAQELAESDHNHSGAPSQEMIDSLIMATVVPLEHAQNFGHLVIQDDGGRMKPINTFSSELLRKLSFKDNYNGLTSDQVLLSMMMQPNLWTVTEFIALDKKAENDSIRSLLGVPKDQRYVRLLDFFDEEGNNKMDPVLRDAFATNNPNKFQQDFKDTYFRLGLLNRALSGEILKIFPLLQDENNKWISQFDFDPEQQIIPDSLYANFIQNSVRYYMISLQKAKQSGDYSEPEMLLEAFRQNQRNHGKEVLPSENKISTEVIYNRLDLFNRLYKYYALIGILMFITLVVRIFRDRRIWDIATYLFKGSIFIMLIWHTAGLVLRWYISGHAPWSDAYESILYVSWACMGMGMLLGKKSDMTIAASAFVTAMLLWIAHQSWVDPAIANLQPVLNSYWLMIHVAVIVGSYGPLTVGMILGVVSLILMIMTTSGNKARMTHSLKELSLINELALTVGLVMLTIGNFLGGQWANESWGRYWGWDPKETWALISILVYAFVIHARIVPGLRGLWTFNFLSVLAFGSIMMTYFGVNFYLVGLHSYASGTQVITPSFVWYTLFSVLVLGLISRWRYRVNYKGLN